MTIFSRVLLFVALLCLGFSAWTVHLHPTATYEFQKNATATSLASSSCPSVWDRWIDKVPPTPIPLPKNIANDIGPTKADLKATACSAAIVGKEHVAETWGAGALVALLAAGFCWWQFED
ncbi:MAG: hypothetical protein WBL51_02220 [Acidimicrobiales bacterium]